MKNCSGFLNKSRGHIGTYILWGRVVTNHLVENTLEEHVRSRGKEINWAFPLRLF